MQNKNIFLETLFQRIQYSLYNIHKKNIKTTFIKMEQRDNHYFISITNYFLDTTIILSNIFSQENITFSCSPIYKENNIIEIEFHFVIDSE